MLEFLVKLLEIRTQLRSTSVSYTSEQNLEAAESSCLQSLTQESCSAILTSVETLIITHENFKGTLIFT